MKPAHVGKRFKSNRFGEFIAIEYLGGSRYLVEFVDTGYRCSVRNSRMLDGHVIDRMSPVICGIGFTGDGKYKPNKNHEAYLKWSHMLRRVYDWRKNKNNKKYSDCNVCDEWHNFQNFAEWYYANYPGDGESYDLDKDKKIKGSRTYCPESCSFISHMENAQISNSRVHYLYHPKEGARRITNLAKFMRDNGLGYAPKKTKALPKKQRAWLRIDEDQYREIMERMNE